jgi:hypothetical protein
MWTPGSAGTLATARTPSTVGFFRKASNSRTASNSMFERNSRNANTTIGYTRNVTSIAERTATGNH